MSDAELTKPYVYQPFGSVSHPTREAAGRLWGVGLPYRIDMGMTTITGLTRAEAKAVCDALVELYFPLDDEKDQP